ncbi:MAG: Coenzyme F420 hydrogenase/dehydrogenase, beta subunit C-terminal domain [Pseudomonadota bacterium]
MAQRMDVTDRIVDADLCAGCGACAALAPKQVAFGFDEEGFLRPRRTGPLSRKTAKTVMAVCPGGGQTAPRPHSDPLWGGYASVHEGWAADDSLRHAGASGGALSATCLWLLESGQVDGVYHVAADPENPTGNIMTISRSRADLRARAASRYAPSAPLRDVPALLEKSERLAFVGKPCDVAGLRRWAAIDPRIDITFPVMLSFFCAGVPSAAGADEIAHSLGVAPEDVAQFRFRGKGWPGATEVIDRKGVRHAMSYAESWGGILSKRVQPRCRICADGTGLAADIAFADAWETDTGGYPLFDEQHGRSLILARTSLGQSVLEAAMRGETVVALPLSAEKIAAMQPGQVRRRRELLGRLAGRVLAGMPVPKYRGMGIWACGRMTPLTQSLRAMLGTARRAMLRRRMAK